MKTSEEKKGSNKTGLVSSLIYLGIGVISLTSYILDKKEIKLKFMDKIKEKR